MRAGQPTKYKEEYCKAIVVHMADGRSATSFAASIGVCKRTVNEWANTHDEFSRAMSIAQTKCETWWENFGYEKIRDNEPFNFMAWQFFMKNRFKWRDKQPEEVASVTVNQSQSDPKLVEAFIEKADKYIDQHRRQS